ncbi:UNVERIFIED_CONTAM: hypothetical protein GTU68_058054 [Idotea baltica]|nr:hypothetical protein [Idotea baltica]
MTSISTILTPGCTVAQLPGASRKRVLQQCSELLSAQYPQLAPRELFSALMARERLGTTAIGEGVAIPHCRMQTDAIVAAFFQLSDPINYAAPDDAPVDLLFVLVVPETEQSAHLELLATLAGLFSDPNNRQRLRSCSDDADLHQQLLNLNQHSAA